jgi:hypothetical protein
MEHRLIRPIALAAVMTIAGGLMLRGCARRMERTMARQEAPGDTARGPIDSARAVTLALDAYRTDHRARGEPAPAPRVTAFAADSSGFRIELAPQAGPGTRAVARVEPSGYVELRRLPP